MTIEDMIIEEIGKEEYERVRRWIEYSAKKFAGLDDYHATRESLFLLNRQVIEPKTLFVITNIALDGGWIFPFPQHPLFKNINKSLQQKYSVEFLYLDGIAYFHHTNKPWNAHDAFAEAIKKHEIIELY